MGHCEGMAVVIPVLDDGRALDRLLAELRQSGGAALEIVVVDGGSHDDSVRVAERWGARVVHAAAGRGAQLRQGVSESRGDWVWLLHADSRGIAAALAYLGSRAGADPAWGRFDIAFDQPTPLLRVVSRMMNLRSRYTGICTGDQGIFAHRTLLESVGGVPPQPLMEDIELSRRLKRQSRPLARTEVLTTSARRWRRRGVAATIVSMWGYRLCYWLGSDPVRLARRYYGES